MDYDKVSGNEGFHTYSLPASKSLVQWAAYKELCDNQTSTVPVLHTWEGLYAPGESEKQRQLKKLGAQSGINAKGGEFMALRKDDPIYYKVTIEKLIKQAKENGLEVIINQCGIEFQDKQTGEMALAKVDKFTL